MTKAVTTVAACAWSGRTPETRRAGGSVAAELADGRAEESRADLADTSPAVRAITLRHLLTSTSGYGMVLTECPLQRAMADSEIDVGADPRSGPASGWPGWRHCPLAFQPGEGWRYHHSFGILES